MKGNLKKKSLLRPVGTSQRGTCQLVGARGWPEVPCRGGVETGQHFGTTLGPLRLPAGVAWGVGGASSL